MSIRKISLCLLLLFLLGLAAGGVYLWSYITREAEPVLQPLSQEFDNTSQVPDKARGLKLTPLEVTGPDGVPLSVFIAERDPDEETIRQMTVGSELAQHPALSLHHIDYVLTAVEWDHGIRSSLPLVESLTAAGLRCVVWEPRGLDNARRYCTHGLRESRDIPLILDELESLNPGRELTVIGVGRGFGAGMLLQAACSEPRLRGLVCIDAYSSLRTSMQRLMPDTIVSQVTLALLDLRIRQCTGIESFDVSPVDSAARLPRSVPVLIVNVEQDNPTRTLDDAVGIYKQLPGDCREVWTLRCASDAPDAESRELIYTRDDGRKLVRETLDVKLLPGIEQTMPAVIHWINDCMVPAIRAPQIPTPRRPHMGAGIGR